MKDQEGLPSRAPGVSASERKATRMRRKKLPRSGSLSLRGYGVCLCSGPRATLHPTGRHSADAASASSENGLAEGAIFQTAPLFNRVCRPWIRIWRLVQRLSGKVGNPLGLRRKPLPP